MYDNDPRSCLILSCLLGCAALLCPVPYLDLYACFGAVACFGKALAGMAAKRPDESKGGAA